MAATHISLAELADAKALLESVPENGSIIVDCEQEQFLLTKQSLGRTAAEMLERFRASGRPSLPLDDEWSKDLQEIIDNNRRIWPSPWD